MKKTNPKAVRLFKAEDNSQARINPFLNRDQMTQRNTRLKADRLNFQAINAQKPINLVNKASLFKTNFYLPAFHTQTSK